MIKDVEEPVAIGRLNRFVGIGELGFNEDGALIASMFTTPPPTPRGTWFTAFPISPLSYRKTNPTKAAVARGKDCLVIYDDYGTANTINASRQILDDLLTDCLANGLPLVEFN